MTLKFSGTSVVIQECSVIEHKGQRKVTGYVTNAKGKRVKFMFNPKRLERI